MSGEGFPSFPHASAHARALAARALHAVPDDADYRNPEPLVARVNAYGAQANLVVSHAPAFSVVQLNPATVNLTWKGAA